MKEEKFIEFEKSADGKTVEASSFNVDALDTEIEKAQQEWNNRASDTANAKALEIEAKSKFDGLVAIKNQIPQ